MSKEDITFSINLDSAVPVYQQIENQVQFAIVSGRLKPEDNLPSVREMATTLTTNPNTVTKAYRDLELRGLVHTRRGVGVLVTKDAAARCGASTRASALAHLREAVGECAACGISTADIRQVVKETIDGGLLPYPADPKSAR